MRFEAQFPGSGTSQLNLRYWIDCSGSGWRCLPWEVQVLTVRPSAHLYNDCRASSPPLKMSVSQECLMDRL